MNYTTGLRPKGKLLEAWEEYERAAEEVDRAAHAAIESGVTKVEVAEILGIAISALQGRLRKGRSLVRTEYARRS